MSGKVSDLRSADRRSVWHPYTRHSAQDGDAFPVIERGEGVYLYDADGNRYLDAISSWWCCNLGHSNQRLVRAMQDQAGKLQHSILGNMSHRPAIELSGKIADLFTDKGRRVFYASDGASAVEAALKIALQYWFNLGVAGKSKFIALENAYHGDTIGALSVGFMPSFHKSFRDVVMPVHRAEMPFCGRCAYGKKPESCGLECFGSMRKLLNEHADEVAAVIVEPLCLGAAGMKMYAPEYLAELSRLCKEKKVLLLVDEIAMGFGRTGKMFAFEHAGIDPDIVCIGKGLSGGYLPISATVVKNHIFEAFGDKPEDHTFYHGHTFAGNPVCAAVALETLKIYEEDDIVQQAARSGKVLADAMADIRDINGVADVRCLGMIGAVEFGGDDGSAVARAVRDGLMGEKIIVRPLDNVIYLMLPLVVPEDVILRAVTVLKDVIRAVMPMFSGFR